MTADEAKAFRRADFGVLRSTPTRWADHDTYGHVNNAIHYILIDTAVNGWLIEASGVDIRTLTSVGLVVETGCRYLGEVHFPQEVVVGIGLVGRGRSSIRYRVVLFTDGDEPVAVAHFNHVYVDQQTRRPVPIPPEIEKALLQLTPSR